MNKTDITIFFPRAWSPIEAYEWATKRFISGIFNYESYDSSRRTGEKEQRF